MAAQDDKQGKTLSFWDHLGELRRRLFVCVFSLAIGFVGAWIFKEWLFNLVTTPVKGGLAEHGIYRLTAIETTEAVMVYLKMCVATAIVVSIPVALYQIWAFVKPGLVQHEFRPMRRVAILAVFMFAIGLLFCYRLVLPLVIDFLTGFTLGAGDIEFQVTMKSAYSTALLFLVGFGVVFELPLVMVLLAATPLFNARRYIAWMRYSIVVSFIVGSMLTPPDVLSQLLMAVPITFLYAIGIALTYLMERRRAKGPRTPSRIDWLLVAGVLVLGGVVALLASPRQQPAVAYLPHGARSVATATGATAKAVGCMPANLAEIENLRLTCATYDPGFLLLVEATGDSKAKPGCDLMEAPETSGLACGAADDVVVVGDPLLVARYTSNMERRQTDSDPVVRAEKAALSFFVSLEATKRQQQYFVRVVAEGGKWDVVRIDLAFPDSNEAEDFVTAMGGQEEVLASTSVAPADDPQRLLAEAVEELAGAIDELAVKAGSEAAAIRERVARVREITHGLYPQASRTSTGKLSACRDAYCAFGLLAPTLPEAGEFEVRGRLVSVEFKLDGRPDQTLALLAEILAATR